MPKLEHFRLTIDLPMDATRMAAVVETLSEIVASWIYDDTTNEENERVRWIVRTLETASRELASFGESRTTGDEKKGAVQH
jgi:hypothetical protein